MSIVLHETQWRILQPFKHAVTPYTPEYVRAEKSLKDGVRELLEEAQETIQVQTFTFKLNFFTGEQFIVHYLIDPQSGLSEDEIVNELLLMVVAGHDTTAHAMSWMAYLMITHPEERKFLEEEINSVVPDGPIENAHLSSLRFFDQCWKESSRLYPTVPASTVKMATEEFKLGKWTFPKGVRNVLLFV